MGRLAQDPERYEWLQWIHYSETMAVHAASLVQQRFFIAAADRSAVIAKLEGRRLEKAVQVLEPRLIDREYLLRSGFSAADIGVGYSLHLADRLIELAKFPGRDAVSGATAGASRISCIVPEGIAQAISWLPQSEPIK